MNGWSCHMSGSPDERDIGDVTSAVMINGSGCIYYNIAIASDGYHLMMDNNRYLRAIGLNY
jgi:hypothetical protein